MIIGFQHKGLELFFNTGSVKGIQPNHSQKLTRILGMLDVAQCPQDLMLPSFKLHQLRGTLSGHWSIWVNGNWRVTFRFIGADVEMVNYVDYH